MSDNKENDIVHETGALVDSVPEEPDTRHEIKKQKILIWKNVLIVSFAFSVNFMAFNALQNAQSSLNAAGGLGVASLSVVYSCSVFSGMFLTPLIIRLKGCKWSLVAFTFSYVAYAGANFYPTWYTMMPASVILGFGAGPLWAAKCTYMASSALQYVAKTGKKKGPVVTQFFGVFQFVLLVGNILGNVLMSVILKRADEGLSSVNRTMRLSCGAVDCPSKSAIIKRGNETTVARAASVESVHLLMGIFTGAIAFSGLILLLVDEIDTSEEQEKKKKVPIKWQLLAVARIVYKDKRMTFLVPLLVYAGLFPGFMAADFAKSYVTCAVGIENLGFVMISHATTQAIFAAFIGKVERYTGRRVILFTSYVTCMGLFVSLLQWDTSKSPIYLFYLVAGAFGLTKCVWRTETNSMVGVIFAKNQETAFSVLRVCTSVGFLMSFAWGYYLCVYVKIYIHICFLTLSMVGYGITEHLEHKRELKEIEKKDEELALQETVKS